MRPATTLFFWMAAMLGFVCLSLASASVSAAATGTAAALTASNTQTVLNAKLSSARFRALSVAEYSGVATDVARALTNAAAALTASLADAAAMVRNAVPLAANCALPLSDFDPTPLANLFNSFTLGAPKRNLASAGLIRVRRARVAAEAAVRALCPRGAVPLPTATSPRRAHFFAAASPCSPCLRIMLQRRAKWAGRLPSFTSVRTTSTRGATRCVCCLAGACCGGGCCLWCSRARSLHPLPRRRCSSFFSAPPPAGHLPPLPRPLRVVGDAGDQL